MRFVVRMKQAGPMIFNYANIIVIIADDQQCICKCSSSHLFFDNEIAFNCVNP